MKQKWKSLALLLLVCVLVVAAPLGVGAAQGLVNLDENCSLTVNPGASADKFPDLNSVDLVADLYQVAKAVEDPGYDSYDYEALDLYADFDLNARDWEALGAELANIALAQDTPVASSKVNTQITDLQPGLYLVAVHEADAEDYVTTVTAEDGVTHTVTAVHTTQYDYTFAPVLVSLPTKEADDEDNVNTANPGDWLYNATITMKPEQDNRLGELKIIKHLTEYRPGAVSEFTFSVDVYLDGVKLESKSNVYTIGFTDGESQTITVSDLPIGAEVVVTEVNSGSYHLVVAEGESGTQTVEIKPDLENVVEFTNAPDDTPKGGGSVINNFVYGDNGYWNWTPVRP